MKNTPNGFYVEKTLNARQRYKIKDENISEKIPLDSCTSRSALCWRTRTNLFNK